MFRIVGREKHAKYMFVRVEGHPHADKRGRVLEHRAVMELKLGRFLKPGEVVHHKNGMTRDNRPENLEVMKRGDHTIEHFGPRKMVVLKCPECGRVFKKPENQTAVGNKTKKNSFCSRRCSGRYNGRLSRD